MSESSQFLYRIQPTRATMLVTGPTSEEEAIVAEHFAYLQRLTEEGIVLVCGRTMTVDENTFGIVIFLSESEYAARAIMQNDPAVKLGVMKAELFPFRIVLQYKGWLPTSSQL